VTLLGASNGVVGSIGLLAAALVSLLTYLLNRRFGQAKRELDLVGELQEERDNAQTERDKAYTRARDAESDRDECRKLLNEALDQKDMLLGTLREQARKLSDYENGRR
jgi:biopolymer transport protein ExbB/TolQ